MHTYFNVYVGIGAFTEAVKMGAAILYERSSFFELCGLLRGLVRAARKAVARVVRMYSLRIGGLVQ